MPHLTEEDVWRDKIFQIETSTPALGGEPVFLYDQENGGVTPIGGHDNIQAKLLADRTRNLHRRLLTLENQMLHQRLNALETSFVGDLVTLTWYPENLLQLPDYAFSGMIWARGQSISRVTYSRLFLKVQHQLGSVYGQGDGETTFQLPDYRGEFFRGWDGGRGVDIGRIWGAHQDDEFKAHVHDSPTTNDQPGVKEPGQHGANGNVGYDYGIQSAPTGPTGGIETRPRNYPLLICIRL